MRDGLEAVEGIPCSGLGVTRYGVAELTTSTCLPRATGMRRSRTA